MYLQVGGWSKELSIWFQHCRVNGCVGMWDSGHSTRFYESMEQGCAILGSHGGVQEIPCEAFEVSILSRRLCLFLYF